MSIGITVGAITDEIGNGDFIHAFFSSICALCEPNGWGSKYPLLMNELYQGSLAWNNAKQALLELKDARLCLEKFPPAAVVWDINEPDSRPPWGDKIAGTITNMGNYFVSSSGRDLFDLLEEALEASYTSKKDAIIEHF
ncbi:Imm70 family immunity protein [Pseudaquidulcibacter saccharophilus]|uniref:Imm70 family immunity protein n=1 Tax=Pseudaquidulcibacter saccharophilus TaxID=2831900 RepID=UPI001EFEF535|nr:Imm70 family immunity protein [Pseudaquidulcibacter saccharophilus]